jgi:hypothetical protein
MAIPAGGGRVQLAFDETSPLVWAPAWTNLDQHPNLISQFTIDRGRAYELDQTDGGRATIDVTDPTGLLDPTNPAGPYFGKIEAGVQVRLQAWDPERDVWEPRFRGWISDMDYEYDPSQQFAGRLQIEATDIFDWLGNQQMLPGKYGNPPPADSEGQIYFQEANADERIIQTLGNAAVPTDFYVVFSLNVTVPPGTYSPGESPLEAIQDAVEADLPAVANAYPDRFGRLAVHGRQAKFDPAGVASGATPGAWDWHHWQAGDLTRVQATPGAVAQLRRFRFQRGSSKVINQAMATPQWVLQTAGPPPVWRPPTEAEIAAQTYEDFASQDKYGVRPWSAQNLQTDQSLVDGAGSLVETKRFAQFRVDNYAVARDRVAGVQFRSIRPGRVGSQITWKLLTQIDIADQIDLSVAPSAAAEGGGFLDEAYYVEGIHETVAPLNPDYDNITIELDLSPAAYYANNPWAALSTTGPPAPVLTQLVPDSSGTWDAEVRLLGSNFTPASEVVANDQVVQDTTFVSDSELRVVVPGIHQAGSYQVKVRTAGEDSNELTFTAL